jgi:histidinol-phosphate aminotransferase
MPPLRGDLLGLTAYGAPQLDVPVRLNVNENPFPLPESVVEAIAERVRQCAAELNRYPDREALDLRNSLVSYLSEESEVQVAAEQVWPANGSNEVMQHLFQAYGGPERCVVSFEPTYSMYAEYARTTCTDYQPLPRAADFTLDLEQNLPLLDAIEPALVIVASPNNPTGTVTPIAQVRELALRARTWSGLVVVDEAYIEFRRPGTPTCLELLASHPNLVVTRTLSKAFGLAGARIGYAVAGPNVVDGLRLVRLPYHLSAVSQAVADAALAHRAALRAQVGILRQERDALSEWLVAEGWQVIPSDANFLTFGAFADRDLAWQGLLDAGVLVRATGPAGYLRVSIGTPHENARFRAALQDLERAGHRSGLQTARGHGDATSSY